MKNLKKKANISMMNIVTGLVMVIVAIIVIFQIVGNSAGDLSTAAGNISGSGLPMASMFSSNGVVMMCFMAALLIGIISLSFYAIRHKR